MKRTLILPLILFFGISTSVFAYSEVVYDGTNVPTVSHGDCLILDETLAYPPQPSVSGNNFPFSGTGYIENTGGAQCNLSNAQFTTVLNNFCGSRSDNTYAWEWGENALFPFTADYWGYFNCSGGVWFPLNYNSRIDSISVSTTTGQVNITGYWNATTTTGIFQQLEFYQESSLLGQQAYTTVNATTTGNFNLNFDYIDVVTPYNASSTMPITVQIDFFANLYQKDNNYYNPFGEQDVRYSTLLDATTTSLIASSSASWTFSSTTDILLYPEYECSITNIIGCIKNAMIWAFYPSSETISRYNSLVEAIQKKAPIGYFLIVKSAITGLNASSTSAFTLTIPTHIRQYLFDPVDVGIASIFWIYFIFMFYKRLKHIQI